MKRLKRLYVNTASSFCMIIGSYTEFKRSHGLHGCLSCKFPPCLMSHGNHGNHRNVGAS